MPQTENYIIDILSEAIGRMEVPIIGSIPAANYVINFQPGSNIQISNALKSKDGTDEVDSKYPLIGVVMPFSERNSSGFLEVTIPRIVIAYLTKTDTNTEFVKDKYTSNGIFKTILRPLLREFIKQIAFSTYTSIGDPDMYEYTTRDYPSQQPMGAGLQDFVDIIEILNLRITIYPFLNNC